MLKETFKIGNKVLNNFTGADSKVLRTSSAEYCAPGWLSSTHMHYVDNHLNCSMRTGTIKSTSTVCLPVLYNIPPQNLGMEESLEEIRKISQHVLNFR